MNKLILILMLSISTAHANHIDDHNITANPEVFLPIVIGTGITAVGTVLDLTAMKLVLNPRVGLTSVAVAGLIGTGLIISGVGIASGGVVTGLAEWAEGK